MGQRQLSQYVDVTVQPLYDTATVPAAGALTLTYFSNPIGAAGGNFTAAASNKVLADSNMDLAGQLPSGQNFRVLGFRAQPHFALTTADAQKWSSGSWFLFTVGQKPYLRVPTDTLPAGVGPDGSVFGTAATGGILSHGFPALANSFQIGRQSLELASGTNFQATLNWVAVVAVTTTAPTQPAAGLPVRIYLDGFFFRSVQ